MFYYIRESLFASRHAFKHGLDIDDLEYAWIHFVVRRNRSTPFENVIVAIGPRRNGNLIQMVATEQPFGIVIYHALEPPTNNVLDELGIPRR